jgi:hypothetical protein
MHQDAPYFIILLYLMPDDLTRQGLRGSGVLPLIGFIHQDPGHVQLFGIEIARLI